MERKLKIREVDAGDEDVAEIIHEFNKEEPAFPVLKRDELEGRDCFWWLAFDDDCAVGFAGVVPSRLYSNCGYLKRAYVAPHARGQGLQLRFFRARERKARQVGWNMLVSECTGTIFSANNFIRAGYEMFEPKEKWAFRDSLYWRKHLD